MNIYDISNDKVRKLASLIEDFQKEEQQLTEMRDRWNDHDDPGSDPGLQYEQESRVEKAFDDIKEFAKTL